MLRNIMKTVDTNDDGYIDYSGKTILFAGMDLSSCTSKLALMPVFLPT